MSHDKIQQTTYSNKFYFQTLVLGKQQQQILAWFESYFNLHQRTRVIVFSGTSPPAALLLAPTPSQLGLAVDQLCSSHTGPESSQCHLAGGQTRPYSRGRQVPWVPCCRCCGPNPGNVRSHGRLPGWDSPQLWPFPESRFRGRQSASHQRGMIVKGHLHNSILNSNFKIIIFGLTLWFIYWTICNADELRKRYTMDSNIQLLFV